MRNTLTCAKICRVQEPHVIKVVLRDLDGRYLAGHTGAWNFVDDPRTARVFDYVRDRISEQLEALEYQHGLVLTAVTLDPRDRYEICDRCGTRVMSVRTFFDGTEYLCPDCHEQKTLAEKSKAGSAPLK